MNRLIIDKKGKIEIKNSSLIFEERKYPLSKIDFLILAGDIEIDTKTVSKITKENISILIYNKNFSFIYPVNSKNGELKKAQFYALNKRLDIAKWIIEGKIKNSFLKIDFSYDLKKVNSIEELMGVEGAFSRKYFAEYFKLFPIHLTKGCRTKQPPEDVVNALMSYMYTIVYYEITNKLILFGFEPQIGYLHEPFRSHNALSSDLLEFFRSDVDKFVFNLFNDKVVKKSDFNIRFRLRDNKRKELWKEIKIFTENLPINQKISHLRNLL
ncbi:CRISPR-associated endonuclease Cas1 [Nautilia sp.]